MLINYFSRKVKTLVCLAPGIPNGLLVMVHIRATAHMEKIGTKIPELPTHKVSTPSLPT